MAKICSKIRQYRAIIEILPFLIITKEVLLEIRKVKNLICIFINYDYYSIRLLSLNYMFTETQGVSFINFAVVMEKKMKKIGCVKLILALFLLCWSSSALALTIIGEHPFYRPPLQSAADLQHMFATEKDQVKIGLRSVGLRPVYDSLMAQIENTEMRTVFYEKGTEFIWMFFRKNGDGPLRIDNIVKWEGEDVIEAYEFDITHEGMIYTFAVPKVCGNLALLAIKEVPPPAEEPVAVVAAEEVITEPEAVPEPEPAVVAEVEVVEPFKWVADAGVYYQTDPATHAFVRVGVERYITDTVSLLGMVGIAPKVHGIDGDGAVILDAIVTCHCSNMFAGLGVGAWLSSGDHDIDTEDSDINLILNFGTKVYEKPDAYAISLFAEARAAFDEMDMFDETGIIGGGLRLNF